MTTNPLPSITVTANAVTSTALSPPPKPAPDAQPTSASSQAGQAQAQAAAAADQPPTPDTADYRLVIEDDKAAGSYVYKTIDRRTGEVISQVPREQILKMREAFGYAAGDVINAKA
jgi:flagellar protein FlaG